MTLSIVHSFLSTIPDGPDTTLVRPSSWNQAHTITAAAQSLLGRGPATSGAVGEIFVGTGLTLSGANGSLLSTTSAAFFASIVTSVEIATSAVTTTAIANGAVTYAKLQNETGKTLLGNPSTASGTPSEITPNAQHFSFSVSTFSLAIYTQRSVTASPITVASTDVQINFNITSVSPACTLPAASSRNGVPVIFKDSGGHSAAHNLTLTALSSVDTIDGAATLVMGTNFQTIKLTPYNDGVNAGWAVT